MPDVFVFSPRPVLSSFEPSRTVYGPTDLGFQAKLPLPRLKVAILSSAVLPSLVIVICTAESLDTEKRTRVVLPFVAVCGPRSLSTPGSVW